MGGRFNTNLVTQYGPFSRLHDLSANADKDAMRTAIWTMEIMLTYLSMPSLRFIRVSFVSLSSIDDFVESIPRHVVSSMAQELRKLEICSADLCTSSVQQLLQHTPSLSSFSYIQVNTFKHRVLILNGLRAALERVRSMPVELTVRIFVENDNERQC